QPQHATRYRGKQTQPDVKDLGQDLVGVVEAAEYEDLLGQTAGRTRRRRTTGHARGIARKRHVRHIQRSLGVEALQRLRQAEAVGEDVVVPLGAERAGKADAIDLDRRRPQREDPFPGVERVAVAIDEDGDAVLANALRDAGDRLLA